MNSIPILDFDFICNHVHSFLWNMHQGHKLFPIGEMLLLHAKLHMGTISWNSNKFTFTTLPSTIRIPSCESLFNYFIKFFSFIGSEGCVKTCLYSSFPSHFPTLTQGINQLSSSNLNNISIPSHLIHNADENQCQA